jgi:sugar O-acyltransferase (sialic acid O-acetyltransferase NeuD family)
VPELVVLGAGGHGETCAEIASATKVYSSISFSDTTLPHGTIVGQWEVKYEDAELLVLDRELVHAFIGVGQIRLSMKRARLFEWLISEGYNVPNIVSPTSQVAPSARLGDGTLVGNGAVVNTSATIGRNCIINSLSLIEHGVIIGNHVHVSTSAVVNGGCRIGDSTIIGSNATISNDITICSWVLIGAGAVVARDIDAPGVYVGVPARRVSDG